MYKNKKIALILLMGGVGNRFSSDIPKQFYNLSGKKIYIRTLDAFYKLNIFDEIVLPCKKEYIPQVKEDLKAYKNIKVIEGGSTRQKSSYQALKSLNNPNIVVIHDSVRPFVSKKIIIENILAAIKYKAVDTCINSTDTLVITHENFIKNIPNRNIFLRGQTPQSFEYKLILSAHEKAIKNNILNKTDDCQLVLENNKVFIVNGDENNIKITTKLDLFLAEQLLRLKLEKVTFNIKNKLDNKIFAIIGASGDIGSEIRKELEKQNAKALLISRNSYYKTDITKYSDVKRTFNLIYKKYGKIDGLINASGLLVVKTVDKIKEKEIDEIIKVNLLGLIYVCKYAKIKDGGHIINISSSSYTYGRKNYGVYSSTKAAVVNFTQSLSQELEKLKVNVIVPQRCNTKMRKKYFQNEDPKTLLDKNKVAKGIIDTLKSDFTGLTIEIKK